MERLTAILRIQGIVFFVYGIAFLLAPDFTLDSIFGWEGTQTIFVRVAGAAFLGLGWFDWLVANRIESRMDMAWPLVLVPTLLLTVAVWQRLAGNYEGTESFYWVTVAVTAFFAVSVGGLRMLATKPADGGLTTSDYR